MAADRERHSDKYYCPSCATHAIKAYERSIVAVIREIIQFIRFKNLKIGYASFIPNVTDKLLSISDDSDTTPASTDVVVSSKDISIKRTLFLYKNDKKKKNGESSQAGNIHFVVDSLPYVDIEMLNRMLSMISETYVGKEKKLLSSVSCCKKNVLPIITLEDIIVFNQHTLVNGQEVTPVTIQIKSAIKPHRQQILALSKTRFQITLSNISNLMRSSYLRTDVLIQFNQSDVNRLYDAVLALFTDILCGEIMPHHVVLIHSCNKNIDTKKHEMSSQLANMIDSLDAVFLVENYTTIYTNSFLDKYINIFIDTPRISQTPLPWNMVFLGLEPDPKNKTGINENVIIGFRVTESQQTLQPTEMHRKHDRKESDKETITKRSR
jgi:hypothetical protein